MAKRSETDIGDLQLGVAFIVTAPREKTNFIIRKNRMLRLTFAQIAAIR